MKYVTIFAVVLKRPKARIILVPNTFINLKLSMFPAVRQVTIYILTDTMTYKYVVNPLNVSAFLAIFRDVRLFLSQICNKTVKIQILT
jgi:hypothetical protein